MPTDEDELEEAIFYALREHLTMIEARQILADEPNLDDGTILALRNIASDIHAALTPAVAPLRPGETVTIPLPYIPAVFGEFGLSIKADDEGTPLLRTHVPTLGPDHVLILDLAGMQQLEATCRRARAALEGE